MDPVFKYSSLPVYSSLIDGERGFFVVFVYSFLFAIYFRSLDIVLKWDGIRVNWTRGDLDSYPIYLCFEVRSISIR